VNSFIDTVAALHPMYLMRAFGGLLYLTGAIIMAYNIWMTIAGYQRAEAPLGNGTYDEASDRPIVQQSPARPQTEPAE
jgi:cytochrome c oxidase cbb3-type subunit 1